MSHTQALLSMFEPRLEGMVDLLRRLVELDSPSNDKAAVDTFSAFLAGQFQEMGAKVERVPQGETGDHLLVRWGGRTGQALIICHMDTVWPVGTAAARPFRVENGRAHGPGVCDMKGGIAIVLYALRVLSELDQLPRKQVVVLLNSDEELGSPTSRSLIELEAKQSDYVLVMEPDTSPEGTATTSRKGVGRFHLMIRGRASHAGRDHEKGISAVEELARQILELHKLTDYGAGITVNVGVVSGGMRPNVVADEAWADVDLRVKTARQGEEMVDAILSLKPSKAGIQLEITGAMNRPPMERSPHIIGIYEKAKELGARLGLTLDETSTGGGSDGNFTAALGVPTLDGLGVSGDGPHSVDEYAVIESLPQRAALLATLLLQLE